MTHDYRTVTVYNNTTLEKYEYEFDYSDDRDLHAYIAVLDLLRDSDLNYKVVLDDGSILWENDRA